MAGDEPVTRDACLRCMEAHRQVHELEREARQREQVHADHSFLKANDVREQIAREREEYVRLDMHKILENRLDKLESRANTLDGKIVGAGLVVTLIFAVAQFALHFMK